jgi:MFS family permease
VSGALLAPSALSLLTTTFSKPKDRGKAFAVFGAVAGGGGAVGLLLGGALTEYLSWRWCLYVNLVFTGVAAAGAVVCWDGSGRPGTPGWTCPAPPWSPAACSASSTVARTPRRMAGTPRPPGAFSSPA